MGDSLWSNTDDFEAVLSVRVKPVQTAVPTARVTEQDDEMFRIRLCYFLQNTNKTFLTSIFNVIHVTWCRLISITF